MPAISITDLSNAKTDVDHIAAIATSTSATATDRLGHTKPTIKGAMDAITAKVAEVEAAKNTAVNTTIPAKVADANDQIDQDVAHITAVATSPAMTVTDSLGHVKRTLAGLSADFVNAGVYPSTAAGLAATSAGQHFSTIAPDDADYLILHLNSAGAAVEQKRYPSAAPVQANTTGLLRTNERASALEQVAQLAPTITLPTIGECASVTVNDAGRVIEAITKAGVRYIEQEGSLVKLDLSGRSLTAPSIDVPGIGVASLVYIDEDTGAVVGGMTTDGVLFHIENNALSRVGTSIAPAYSGDGTDDVNVTTDDTIVDCWVVVGQSLGAGTNNDLDDATVSGAAQHSGYAFTFGSGPTPNYATSPTLTTLGDLREVPLNVSGTPFWESICSRFAWTLLDKMQASISRKQKLFVWSTAVNGAAFRAISRGSTHWGKFIAQMTGAKSALVAAGYKPRLRGMLVLHGEADTTAGVPRTQYKKTLAQWRQWAEEDARAIFGDVQDSVTLEMLTYQTNRGGTGYFQLPQIAVAQLDVNDQNPHTTCAGPVYWVTGDASDGIHPNAISYARLGEQFAEVAYRRTYSGQSFAPLHVVDSYWLDATHIRIKYTAPVAVEATDDLVTISTLGAGKGFDYFDGQATPPTVTNVAVISGNEIEITLSGASTGKTPRLYYACRKTGDPYRVGGHRGGVRAATAYMTSAVTAQPNYHWAAQQVFNIGEMK